MAAKVTVSKESTTIVGDGRSEGAVAARVRQIKNMIAETEQDYEREKLNERMARLSGGVAVIQVRQHLARLMLRPSSTRAGFVKRENQSYRGAIGFSGLQYHVNAGYILLCYYIVLLE
jgi:hypothetical protein